MLRLNYFKVTGFKAGNRYAEVHFSKSPISVIFGENGSGKTSFLKAVYGFLSQDDAALTAIGAERIECKFIDDTGNEKSVEVIKEDLTYNWSQWLDSDLRNTSSLSLGVERGISTQLSRIDPGWIRDLFQISPRYRRIFKNEDVSTVDMLSEELADFVNHRQQTRRTRRIEIDFTKSHLNLQNIKLENIETLLLDSYRLARISANRRVQSALFNTLAGAITQNLPSARIPPDFYKTLDENKLRLLAALDDNSPNEFKNSVIKILTNLNETNFESDVIATPLLSRLFQNMISELEAEKLALGSINLLVDKFNQFLIEGKKLVVTEEKVYVDVNGGQHTIHDLSSGERHILTFLSLVLFHGQKRNFLIIDEPEISLNIVWQRELLSLFGELLPTTQIIVASHSPFLAKRSPALLTPLLVGRIK